MQWLKVSHTKSPPFPYERDIGTLNAASVPLPSKKHPWIFWLPLKLDTFHRSSHRIPPLNRRSLETTPNLDDDTLQRSSIRILPLNTRSLAVVGAMDNGSMGTGSSSSSSNTITLADKSTNTLKNSLKNSLK
mmetsp:Transcript_6019/g.11060  ORF Transcript_6019/g.11060 Transcript_6019/m.11060 type:complete len:132 (+) Transcript_6019:1398-1793(+)